MANDPRTSQDIRGSVAEETVDQRTSQDLRGSVAEEVVGQRTSHDLRGTVASESVDVRVTQLCIEVVGTGLFAPETEQPDVFVTG